MTWLTFWQFLTILTIFDNFDNFWQFLTILTILKFFDNFGPFSTILTISDNFDNLNNFWKFWQFWQFLQLFTIFTMLTFFTIDDNWRQFRQLLLPFWQLKRKSWRLVTFETLITILTIENMNSWQSLLPDN